MVLKKLRIKDCLIIYKYENVQKYCYIIINKSNDYRKQAVIINIKSTM